VLAFGVGFAVTACAVVAALDAAGIRYSQGTLEVIALLTQRIERTPQSGAHRVIFLGDSLAMDTRPPDRSIPIQLAEMLRAPARRTAEVHLRSVVASGLGLFSQYFLSDRVLERQPDQVVLGLNLRWFSKVWFNLEREQLAGLLPARHWSVAAALPLARAGITADRLVFYRAVMAARGFRAWHRLQREQVRALRATAALAEGLQAASPFPDGLDYRLQHSFWRMARDGGTRVTREAARRQLGRVLAGLPQGDPGLRVLDAMLEAYRAAGIPVLVYVAPLNVEHLRGLGVLDETGLARSLARIEAVARARGADFLDLHALLGDSFFKDPVDHLSTDPPAEGPRRVAAALLPRLGPAPGAREQSPPSPPREG
jgi:hypothetical protein